jgi:hypothetical protein
MVLRGFDRKFLARITRVTDDCPRGKSEMSVTAEINEEQDIRTDDDVVVIGLDVRDCERDVSLRQIKALCEIVS